MVSANEVITKTGADAVMVLTSHPMLNALGLDPRSRTYRVKRTVAGKNFRITGRTSDKSALHIDLMRWLMPVFLVLSWKALLSLSPLDCKMSKVLTIGIGASAACDGQILVTDDMLGLYDAFNPKFVRKFTNLQDEISRAVECYCAAVIDGSFHPKTIFLSTKKKQARRLNENSA